MSTFIYFILVKKVGNNPSACVAALHFLLCMGPTHLVTPPPRATFLRCLLGTWRLEGAKAPDLRPYKPATRTEKINSFLFLYRLLFHIPRFFLPFFLTRGRVIPIHRLCCVSLSLSLSFLLLRLSSPSTALQNPSGPTRGLKRFSISRFQLRHLSNSCNSLLSLILSVFHIRSTSCRMVPVWRQQLQRAGISSGGLRRCPKPSRANSKVVRANVSCHCNRWLTQETPVVLPQRRGTLATVCSGGGAYMSSGDTWGFDLPAWSSGP
jgi:hypothetical protein